MERVGGGEKVGIWFGIFLSNEIKRHSPTLHGKSIGESRDKRNKPKHNKGNLEQASSQHQTKWKEAQSDPIEIRNKTRLSNLSISIQCSS